MFLVLQYALMCCYRSAGGKLVDASPEIQKDYDEALDRVNQRFGAAGKDMTKFPEFKFEGK